MTGPAAKPAHSRWFTKRFMISAVGFVTATALLILGKLTGECWVYSLAIVIAGHHAEDVIAAMRKGS